MRLAIVILLLGQALVSQADATSPPCVTSESHARAWAAASSYLPEAYVDPSLIDTGDEFLFFGVDCEVHQDRSATCNVDTVPNTPIHFQEAARAYYEALEFCPTVAPGPLRDHFTVGVNTEY